MILGFKKLVPNAEIPTKAHDTDAGMDVKSVKEYTLFGGKWLCVETGLSAEIPKGYEIQVRPRSGLSAKYGVTVLNSPGTIDADYRGEIKVILINHGTEPFKINIGDRIAQLVMKPIIETVATYEVTELSNTERGDGGFGSSGK